MKELYLCYAGFVYFLIKKGYRIVRQGKNYLGLLLDNGKCYYFQVHADEKNTDCGYVYTNTEDLKSIFKDDPELVQTLTTVCVRPLDRSHNRADLPHCSIDLSLRGKMKTLVEGEKIVNCLQI